jgi:hypothetical protein
LRANIIRPKSPMHFLCPHKLIVTILLFAVVSSSNVLFAQRAKAFIPAKITYTNDTLKTYVKQRCKQDVEALTYDDKYVKKDIKEVYEERTKLIEEIIESGTIVTDPKINAYYQQILKTIIDGNPSITTDIKLLVVRYDWPNAVCYGNGVLLINLGLVERLENEAQIAFVISHEIAHQYSNHVNKKISKWALQLNSEEAREKLKDVSMEKDGAKIELFKFVKGSIFDIRKHFRDNELEADSIAFLFMLNTPYDHDQGARTMEILDSIDQEFFEKSILDFRWFFDSLAIPYKQSWEFLSKASSLKVIEKTQQDSIEEDSLKTHPDCILRRDALIRQSKRHNSEKSYEANVQGITQFRYQLNASYVEVINTLYTDSSYAGSIYKAMEMAHIYQDDAYPHIIISSSLGELNINQRNRTLGKVLPLPRYGKTDPFHRVVAFLNELSRTETAALGYWYLRKTVTEIPENEDYIYAMFITAYAFDKTEEAKKYMDLYQKKFADGKYQSKIKRYKI